MEKTAEKKSGLFSEVLSAIQFSNRKNKSFISESWSGFKELCNTSVNTTTEFLEDSILAGTIIGVLIGGLVALAVILFGIGLLILYFLCIISAIEKTVRIIWRRISSRVTLTATKQQAYACYRENLWKVFNEYHEDLKIHRCENSYSLTSSNCFILRHNVWMCCYNVRKKSPVPFEDEHLEFIEDTINGEITAMLENGDFEGVVYPCNYKFAIDEIKDAKNTVKIYVLCVEDNNDIAYLTKKNADNHDTPDTHTVMEDSDFGHKK